MYIYTHTSASITSALRIFFFFFCSMKDDFATALHTGGSKSTTYMSRVKRDFFFKQKYY